MPLTGIADILGRIKNTALAVLPEDKPVALMVVLPQGWVSAIKMVEKVPLAPEMVVPMALHIPKSSRIISVGMYPLPDTVTILPTVPEVGMILICVGCGGAP